MRIADIETDGLLPELTKIHCINGIDSETGDRVRFNGGVYTDPYTGEEFPAPRTGSIEDGLEWLKGADTIFHNGHGFDYPAIRILFPEWKNPHQELDSLAWAQVIWPKQKLTEKDIIRLRKGKIPEEFKKKGLIGTHRLAAWGYRLKEYKGDFNPKDYGHTWKTMPFCKDMDDYCAQDCEVLLDLVNMILSKDYSEESLDLENRVMQIITRQERHGFYFDREVAEDLERELTIRAAELEQECLDVFKPWYVSKGKFTPKRKNGPMGYTEGVPFTKVELRVFNPGSRDHIADRLQKVLGWEPLEFTETGKPKVDEEILGNLPWPEAAKISEFLMVKKRLGQIADGKNAWLKKVRDDNRIHGRVNTNGTITGRMSHSGPNVAQTPANHAPYGARCRSCFTVPLGRKLVGCDADGLELRELGHYMARFDGGAYVEAVTKGDKKKGTDAHSMNQKALGLNSRDNAKTWFLNARNLSGKPVKTNPVNSGEVSPRQP